MGWGEGCSYPHVPQVRRRAGVRGRVRVRVRARDRVGLRVRVRVRFA